MVAWIIRGSAPRIRGAAILERMVARKPVWWGLPSGLTRGPVGW
jgi:hypothetical protein